MNLGAPKAAPAQAQAPAPAKAKIGSFAKQGAAELPEATSDIAVAINALRRAAALTRWLRAAPTPEPTAGESYPRGPGRAATCRIS